MYNYEEEMEKFSTEEKLLLAIFGEVPPPKENLTEEEKIVRYCKFRNISYEQLENTMRDTLYSSIEDLMIQELAKVYEQKGIEFDYDTTQIEVAMKSLLNKKKINKLIKMRKFKKVAKKVYNEYKFLNM